MQLNSTCQPGNMFSKYFSKLGGDINDVKKKLDLKEQFSQN